MHWVPGHRDIEGNELADQQATEAANEMVGADPEDFPITMDKKEAVAEIKKNVKEKWQRKFELSEKVDQVQEVFSEVGSRNCFGEKDRHSFAMFLFLFLKIFCHSWHTSSSLEYRFTVKMVDLVHHPIYTL